MAGHQMQKTSVSLQRMLQFSLFARNHLATIILTIHCSLFTVTRSPLMAKDRGWGSRPIGGKDWGTSVSCDNATLKELIVRFECSLAMNGMFTFLFIYLRKQVSPCLQLVPTFVHGRDYVTMRRMSNSIGELVTT